MAPTTTGSADAVGSVRSRPRAKYVALALVSLQEAISYRVTTLLSMVSQVIWLVVLFSVWRAAYGPRPALDGFSWTELQTYLVIAFAVNALLSFRSMSQMSAPIRTGQVASELLRPIDHLGAQLARSSGRAVVEGGAVAVMAIGLGAVLIDVTPPASPLAAVAFAVAVAQGFVVKFLVHHLVTLLGFLTTNTTGLIWAEVATVNLASGALVPLVFLPQWAQSILVVLPFHAIVATPASVYLGRTTGTSILWALLAQLAWIAALVVLARSLWRPAVRALDIQGG